MALVATLDIIRGASGVCPVDITALFKYCDTLDIIVGSRPHTVDIQPSTICITPTLPTTTREPCHSCTWQTSTTTGSTTSSSPCMDSTGRGSQTASSATTPTTTPCTDSSTSSTTSSSSTTSTPCTDSTTPPLTITPIASTSCTDSSVSPEPTATLPPAPYCAQPLVNITTNLLGLDVDLVASYLRLGGLLRSVGDLVSDLVCGGVLGGCSDGRPLPQSVRESYAVSCGHGLDCDTTTTTGSCRGCPAATPSLVTAANATDCVARCRRAGIQATVQLGRLVDCLGASVHHGVEVDNCLYVVGSKTDLLDLHVEALRPDTMRDTFFVTE